MTSANTERQPNLVSPELSGRLAQQVAFIVEAEQLKDVARQSPVLSGTRKENSAEHSWHMALLAAVLADYADEQVDISRVLRMVLVHDVVEIDAGDTFLYDDAAAADQAEREAEAADRLFALLPYDQAVEYRALWDEFEARATPDARFAKAMDRLQPLLLNIHSGGGSWQTPGVTHDKVVARTAIIEEASPQLWAYARQLLDDAVARGDLQSG